MSQSAPKRRQFNFELTEEQSRQLAEEAQKLGISKSDLIRLTTFSQFKLQQAEREGG